MSTDNSTAARGSERVDRRSFLKFCGMMAATLALPGHYATRIARALAASTRLPVVWLEFQDCTGDSESFLRAGPRADPITPTLTDPGVTDLLFDFISLEYHETLMAPSGENTLKSLDDVLAAYPGQYVCVVEGAIPTAQNGIHCVVHGRTALSIAQEVCSQAKAVVALGNCAWFGGLPAALPNITGAKGVATAVTGLTQLVNLPGCPANAVNLVATLVHFITFNELPAVDSSKRPLFAYGSKIHESCERREFYEDDKFVREWGDAGHRQGWCLKEMGCKGPDTRSNCPRVKWNNATSWPVQAGHGCVGCTGLNFWDQRTPFYVED